MANFVNVGKGKKTKLINVDSIAIIEGDNFGNYMAVTASGLAMKLSDQHEFDLLVAAAELPGVVAEVVKNDAEYLGAIVSQVVALNGLVDNLSRNSSVDSWQKFLGEWGMLAGLVGLDDPEPLIKSKSMHG
jgi:hypothetical protein